MTNYTIAVLPGDGIGPEIMREGMKVLEAIEQKYHHEFNCFHEDFGAAAYRSFGHPFPKRTRELCESTDAILKGPVGVPGLAQEISTNLGNTLENLTIIELRRMHDAFLNVRPVRLPLEFWEFSPLKPERLGQGIDILMMRELTGGIYFGTKQRSAQTQGKFASDNCVYTRDQIERFARVCFDEARKRRVKITSASKPNILATGELWDEVFDQIHTQEYREVPFEKVIIDAHATNLGLNPSRYNGVVAYENLQGDILTDQAGGIIGSLGLMPSACLNPQTRKGFFEPAHGSAPDIADQGKANPYSMIGCVGFMLENLGLVEESELVWKSLQNVFADGYMTSELIFNLTEVQQQQRVERFVAEFLPTYQRINQRITLEELHPIITEHYATRDEQRKACVITTSQFGDRVVERILNERN